MARDGHPRHPRCRLDAADSHPIGTTSASEIAIAIAFAIGIEIPKLDDLYR